MAAVAGNREELVVSRRSQSSLPRAPTERSDGGDGDERGPNRWSKTATRNCCGHGGFETLAELAPQPPMPARSSTTDASSLLSHRATDPADTDTAGLLARPLRCRCRVKVRTAASLP
jgi:hypothetical protein